MNGRNLFTCFERELTPEENIMINMIAQAVAHARGEYMASILNNGNYSKKHRTNMIITAQAYIFSTDFENDCNLLGVCDVNIQKIRDYVSEKMPIQVSLLEYA